MAKNYLLRFGSGNPAGYAGLSPTLIVFSSVPGGSLLAAPPVAELPTSTGLYTFAYGPTISIAFVADAGSSLSASERYIVGILDPVQAVDENIGQPYDSYGSTSSDPSTLLGYAKRNLEVQEGDATFNKTTGVWDIYSRGASTLLREKTLQNTSGNISKD